MSNETIIYKYTHHSMSIHLLYTYMYIALSSAKLNRYFTFLFLPSAMKTTFAGVWASFVNAGQQLREKIPLSKNITLKNIFL